MSVDTRLPVVLCWHMHQPQYRDPLSGEYILPWTYLHAIKDYVDMAAHLEDCPAARAVVNFTPLLLEQIEDYRLQISQYLRYSTPIRDPLLAALAGTGLPSHLEGRRDLVYACLRANEQRLIGRFPLYAELVEMARLALRRLEGVSYLANQFLVDLVVWYHLAWIGEKVRRQNPDIQRLQQKGAHYTTEDRRDLLIILGELLEGLLPRYRTLANTGRIELSMTPWGHPILPLLLDLNVAKEAMPDVPLGRHLRYPGGEERARWHLEEGLAVFERFLGRRPTGCWPAEGGVSNATLTLLGEMGFRWCASGESVLRNSLNRHHRHQEGNWLHRSYHFEPTHSQTETPLTCFFRDDGLADRIGFLYSTWHADDAVGDLVHHLGNIALAVNHIHSTDAIHRNAIVSIVMDGENAWEYYPENGYYFLSALYQRIAEHPHLRLATYSEYLDQSRVATSLPSVVAGSWVYGNFSTWIGSTDKNRGWDMLIEAKRCFDAAVATGRLKGEQLKEIERLLGVCESSDWFWWFGDYNPEETVSSFERLFRRQLTGLYQTLGEAPPDYLTQSFTRGSGSPQLGGVMRPGQAT
ncbi:Glycoside hydrolase [Gammaproteobacteria bacterium]